MFLIRINVSLSKNIDYESFYLFGSPNYYSLMTFTRQERRSM